MTALVVARLVQAGKLRWDSTLAELLPEDARDMRPEYRDVTVVQILSHTAGLPAYTEMSDSEWSHWRGLPGTPTQQRAAFVHAVLAQRPVAPAGTVEKYSNAGYIIAGFIAERASHTPWATLLRQQVLAPLHMDRCRPGWPVTKAGQPGTLGNRQTGDGYEQVSVSRQPVIGAFLAPPGDLSCTATDLARFAQFELQVLSGTSPLIDARN